MNNLSGINDSDFYVSEYNNPLLQTPRKQNPLVQTQPMGALPAFLTNKINLIYLALGAVALFFLMKKKENRN